MTFAEKLMRLRKREGLSQEALAEALGVSRQAVSRWEQGTALPDAAKLLPCARLFHVSVEWLLDESQAWEDRTDTATKAAKETEPAAQRDWIWYLAGGIVTGVGVLGMVVMGILSSVYPVVLMESPAGVSWTRVYTGVIAFLKEYDVEWLFALWAAAALAGLWLLAQPVLRRERFSVPVFCLYAAGTAAAVYGFGQTAWWVQQGKSGDLLLMAASGGSSFLRGAAVSGNAKGSRRGRRRLGRAAVLLYTAAQGIVCLLTAEAGIGLVGLVLHIGVYAICASTLRAGTAS